MVYQRGMEEEMITTLQDHRLVRILHFLKGSGMKVRSSLNMIIPFEHILLLWAI